MKAFLCLTTKPINELSVWSHADELINKPLFMDVSQPSHSGPHWNKRQEKKHSYTRRKRVITLLANRHIFPKGVLKLCYSEFSQGPQLYLQV